MSTPDFEWLKIGGAHPRKIVFIAQQARHISTECNENLIEIPVTHQTLSPDTSSTASMSKENITGVDFMTRAAPKVKRKGKWSEASNMIQQHLATTDIAEKTGKTDRLASRKRSKGGQQRQQRDVHLLRKDPDINPLKKHYFKNWNNDNKEASNVCNDFSGVPLTETVNVNDFVV